MPKASQSQLLAKLDEIEAEMKKIGFWSDAPPDLQAKIASGEMRNYLDAPSFELWLQTIFLPNARARVQSEDLPKESQVGLMALRQYDYHSAVEKALHLTKLLSDFDRMVVGAAK